MPDKRTAIITMKSQESQDETPQPRPNKKQPFLAEKETSGESTQRGWSRRSKEQLARQLVCSGRLGMLEPNRTSTWPSLGRTAMAWNDTVWPFQVAFPLMFSCGLL